MSGKDGIEYYYNISAKDPNGDRIYYLFDWGDGTDSGWLNPNESSEVCEASYIWDEKGEYVIKVKVRDVYGMESEWSDPLVVSMSKNNLLSYFPLLFRFFERH